MSGNREYRSDVFSMLMEDKARALTLYNAINGSDYDDPELVQMKNLEGGISLSIRNDAAFIVDARLSIYEHQSTVNPNMPLRSLIYFTTIIQEMFATQEYSKKSLYNSKLIKIPTPEFVVIYNGVRNQPEVSHLKLSDAFEKPVDDPSLELKCTVYNINAGQNEDLKERCLWLDQYMIFVDKVREFHEGRSPMHLEADIERAISYCIEHDILKDFLIKHRREVTKNMALDFTFDRRLELEVAEAREDAIEEGRAEGRAEGQAQLIIRMNRHGQTASQIASVIDMKTEDVEAILANAQLVNA